MMKYIPIIILLAIYSTQPLVALEAGQYNALHSLYNSAGGPYWVWNNSGTKWNFSDTDSDPCFDNWEGVGCSATCNVTYISECNVIELDLHLHNLTGSLPNNLGDLTGILSLDLSYNRVSGSIPSSVGTLSELVYMNLRAMCLSGSFLSQWIFPDLLYLDFGSNMLSGTLPELGYLYSLVYLNMAYNKDGSKGGNLNPGGSSYSFYTNRSCVDVDSAGLRGTIPASFWSVSTLTGCFLNDNFISGELTVPDGGHPALETFVLSNNALTGSVSSSLSNFSSLQIIDLSYNYLVGTISSGTFVKMAHLREINLGHNFFKGQIPIYDRSLPSLEVLNLEANSFSSTLPSQLFLLSSLRYLDLGDGNCITGPLPENLGMLTNLEVLDISGALLEGTIPSSILRLSKLVTLDLRYNKKKSIIFHFFNQEENFYCSSDRDVNAGLVGEIPPLWDYLFELEYLFLNRNYLTGSLDSVDFSSLPLLRALNVENNFLSGRIPTGFSGLSFLEELNLGYNLFVPGTIPAALTEISSLRSLSLGWNGLYGTIPTSFEDFSYLTFLSLNGNNLTGSISTLWKIPTLRYVELSHNYFSDEIPSAIGNLTNLEFFRVHDNRLNGSIPSTVYFKCTKLAYLDLSENTFTGNLSTAIINLSQLEYFSIYDNHIGGTIPSAVIHMTSLVQLKLNENSFSGNLPDWTSLMPRLQLFDVHDNMLKGPIPNSTVLMIPGLLILDLSENYLSSSVPSALLNSENLKLLDISMNLLWGPLPSVTSVIKNSSLTFLSMYSNSLSQQFPSSILLRHSKIISMLLFDNAFTGNVPDYTKLALLTAYLIGMNSFSGSLPNEVNTPFNGSMVYFDISQNRIGGTIPSVLGIHRQMEVFMTSDNNMAGTLPSNFNFPDLVDLRLHNNNYDGSLPSWLSIPSRFDNCFINSNKFTGKLEGVFTSHQRKITNGVRNLDISDNLFSGSLPADIFAMNKLRIFAASKNCFSGQFPSTICKLKRIEILVLNSLSFSENCPFHLRMSIKYFPVFSFQDTLPGCLFHNETREIYLASNNLHGNLPELGAPMNVIDLSNNLLTGTIPGSYVAQVRSKLLLERNRLSGELPKGDQNASSGEVNFGLNRLSGNIPDFYRSLKKVDILSGNIFYCERNSDLPKNDPYWEAYTCGSNLLNYSLYFWLGIAVIFGAILMISWWAFKLRNKFPEKEVSEVKKPVVGHSADPPPSLYRGSGFSVKSRISMIAQSDHWKQLENCYRWYKTGCLLAGTETNALQPKGDFFTLRNSSGVSSGASGGSQLGPEYEVSVQNIGKYKYFSKGRLSELSRFVTALLLVRSIVLILSVMIVLILLPLYIGLKSDSQYSTHDVQYTWLASAAYVSGFAPAGLFSAVWLGFCVLYFWLVYISYSEFFSNSQSAPPDYIKERQDSSAKRVESVASVSPAAVVFGVSVSKKAKRAFVSISAIILNGLLVLAVTVGYIILIISDQTHSKFIPIQMGYSAWRMSWNSFGVPSCFHAMDWVEHHTKVIIYICTLFFNNVVSVIVASFFSDPSCFADIWESNDSESVSYIGRTCADFSLIFGRCTDPEQAPLEISYTTPVVYHFLCSSSILHSFVPIFFYVYAGTFITLPLFFYILTRVKRSSWPANILRFTPAILWPNECEDSNEKYRKYLVLPNIIMSSMIGHVMILLTFGVFSPFLAVPIAATVYVISSMWIMIIGRYIEYTSQEKTLSAFSIEDIEKSFCDVWTTMYYSRWTVVICAGWSYSILIFDYVGDVAGVTLAITTCMLTGLFFVIIYSISLVIRNTQAMNVCFRCYHIYTLRIRYWALNIIKMVAFYKNVEGYQNSDRRDILIQADDEELTAGIRLTEQDSERGSVASSACTPNPLH